jgi:hypothetical protein
MDILLTKQIESLPPSNPTLCIACMYAQNYYYRMAQNGSQPPSNKKQSKKKINNNNQKAESAFLFEEPFANFATKVIGKVQ